MRLRNQLTNSILWLRRQNHFITIKVALKINEAKYCQGLFSSPAEIFLAFV